MSNKQKETVALAWCDNGMVDGLFAQGMADVLLKSEINWATTIRSGGNQIARQRENVIKYWYENNISDWLFWLDSDIVASPEVFLKLWNKKDANHKPLLTGVYFTSDNPEQPLMVAKPTVFDFDEREDGEFGLKRLDPLPKNQFIKVGAAGMGLVLMHRSVVDRIQKAVPGVPFFSEAGVGTKFIGEDIYFFALCDKAEVPLWCDTSALVPHMKRFSFDVHYYNASRGATKE